MTFINGDPEIPYCMIRTEVLKSNVISWGAKGYYSYLQTLTNVEFKVEMLLLFQVYDPEKRANSMEFQYSQELIRWGFLEQITKRKEYEIPNTISP